jgi:hypothetical protein
VRLDTATAAFFSSGLQDALVSLHACPRLAGVEVERIHPQLASRGVAGRGNAEHRQVRRRLRQEVSCLATGGEVDEAVVVGVARVVSETGGVDVVMLGHVMGVPCHRRRRGQGRQIWTEEAAAERTAAERTAAGGGKERRRMNAAAERTAAAEEHSGAQMERAGGSVAG